MTHTDDATIRPFRDRHPAGRPRRSPGAPRAHPLARRAARRRRATASPSPTSAAWPTTGATGYDWRAVEARLNAHPQFTTEIDGQKVHFLHVRSPEPDALPLIVTHGWPGSIVEFLDIIGAAHRPASARRRPGRRVPPRHPVAARLRLLRARRARPAGTTCRIARAWAELMRRLGYERYGAVGNDAGSMISPELGRIDPEHVVGRPRHPDLLVPVGRSRRRWPT